MALMLKFVLDMQTAKAKHWQEDNFKQSNKWERALTTPVIHTVLCKWPLITRAKEIKKCFDRPTFSLFNLKMSNVTCQKPCTLAWWYARLACCSSRLLKRGCQKPRLNHESALREFNGKGRPKNMICTLCSSISDAGYFIFPPLMQIFREKRWSTYFWFPVATS